MQNLTTHLPTTTPNSLHRATTHPFLRRAGSGQIPKPLLSQWLSQDRLYAQSYVRFIGLLLAKVHLPTTPSPPSPANAKANDENGKAIQEKVLDILISALTNIRTELGFFEDVAREYGLDLNTPLAGLEGYEGRFSAGPITRGYIDMFVSAGSAGTSLLEGLVVLWATEVCYLRAWRGAAVYLDQGSGAPGEAVAGGDDMDGGALRKKFIPNWASDEFGEFVQKIGDVVDELGMLELQGGKDAEDALARCERWWRQVVWLEERFWPDVE